MPLIETATIATGAIALAANKVLGPTAETIGQDLKGLYEKGRDKIMGKAIEKIDNIDDGLTANLRVTRDVFWNGSFTEEDICAEYFGGILASSRSEDGKDDNGIHYTDVIKSLSAKQLELHYVIYNSLNKILIQEDKNINVGMDAELKSKSVWFFFRELIVDLGLTKIDTDLNILYKQGLLSEYEINYKDRNGKVIQYIMVKPTIFGVLLYSIAHNKFDIWREFSSQEFGDFPNIGLPGTCSNSFENLVKNLN